MQTMQPYHASSMQGRNKDTPSEVHGMLHEIKDPTHHAKTTFMQAMQPDHASSMQGRKQRHSNADTRLGHSSQNSWLLGWLSRHFYGPKARHVLMQTHS